MLSFTSSMYSVQVLMRYACFGTNGIRFFRNIGSKPSNGQETFLRELVKDASVFGEAGAAVPAEGELEWATQPYATRAHPEPVTKTDPCETSVLLFPGQGSHYVGMGRELMNFPKARDIYQLASDVLGYDVASLCKEGPDKELERHCQTAIMVTSLAALERARECRPGTLERVTTVAGFSLGEITALVYAGALRMEQALKLVELRTTAMQEAARLRAGGMLTVWFGANNVIPKLLQSARKAATRSVPDPVCEIANYLYPNCKVIAGDETALQYVQENGSKYGVRRTARVPVAGAYHTRLMAPAQDVVREALKLCDVKTPRMRVVSCVDTENYGTEKNVRQRLEKLTTSTVRWEQMLHRLYARNEKEAQPFTLTLGPGQFLRSTLKLVNSPAWATSAQIDA